MGSESELMDSYPKQTSIQNLKSFFTNLFENRTLLRNFVARDFKNTYHGHFLGYVWSMLEPLILTGIFYVMLVILRNDPDNLVPLKIMLGILVYSAFSKTLSASTVSFTRNSSLITQIYFPRELIITSIAGFQSVRLFLSLLIIIPYLIYASISPNILILLLPLSALFSIMLGKGLGMIFVIIHVRFRDLEQMVILALRAGFYMSGVFFSADIIPKEYLDMYFWNPVAVLIETARAGVLGDMGVLEIYHIRNAIIISCLVYLLGILIFKRYERKAVLYL